MNSPEMLTDQKPAPWYFSKRFVVAMLVIFGPLALPLVWLSPKFSITWKIGTTVLAVVLTVLLWKTTTAMFQMLNERLKDIQAASVS